MAGVLLDTHAFIWVTFDTPDLSPAARRTLSLRSTVACVSVVSLWEIAIKVQQGRFEFDEALDVVIRREFENNGYVPLQIEDPHLMELLRQPSQEVAHGDPFDRLPPRRPLPRGWGFSARTPSWTPTAFEEFGRGGLGAATILPWPSPPSFASAPSSTFGRSAPAKAGGPSFWTARS